MQRLSSTLLGVILEAGAVYKVVDSSVHSGSQYNSCCNRCDLCRSPSYYRTGYTTHCGRRPVLIVHNQS